MKTYYTALITASENDYKARCLADINADHYKHKLSDARIRALNEGRLTEEQALAIAIANTEKACKKFLDKELASMDRILDDDRTITRISVEVCWVKSRTWGFNPHVEAKVWFADGQGCETYEGSASGCGYDKLSAGVGNALNQCRPLRRMMAQYKKDHDEGDHNNHKILGYGSGYGSIPYLEGGVGITCHIRILENLGFKCESHGTKHTDSYYFSK